VATGKPRNGCCGPSAAPPRGDVFIATVSLEAEEPPWRTEEALNERTGAGNGSPRSAAYGSTPGKSVHSASRLWLIFEN